MAEQTPIEKLKIIEDDFHKWFRKAYEFKDYTDVDTDLLVRDLPKAKSSTKIQRYDYYKTQFKSTIKVPPQYQDTRELFINALGKYFVDSAKFLYRDQIRYEYTGFQSSNPGDSCWIKLYKSCGNEVGLFCVNFKLEGNLVVAEVGYQIFWQVMPLTSPPEMLKRFNPSALSATGRDDLLGSVATIGNGARYLIIASLFLPCIPVFFCNAAESSVFIKTILLFCAISGYLAPFGCYFLNRMLIGLNEYKIDRRHRRKTALEQDLSPIHFPVKYFNHDDFNEAFTNSHDHQIFFKQLQEVVNRMSALGESSNS
jgi:hypothetical protein